MKTFLFIFLAICSGVSAQKKPFTYKMLKPEYIKIGMSKSDFANWAKVVHQWMPNDFGPGNHSDSSKLIYEYSYDITDSGVKNQIYYTTRYTYFFDKDKVIAMMVDPSPIDEVKDKLLDDHELVEETKRGLKTNYKYTSKKGNYDLILAEATTDVNGMGFETKTTYKISVWPKG
jgi:hypothetical protein